MNDKEILSILLYAIFLYAMYRLYQEYLKAITPERVPIIVEATAESKDDAK